MAENTTSATKRSKKSRPSPVEVVPSSQEEEKRMREMSPSCRDAADVILAARREEADSRKSPIDSAADFLSTVEAAEKKRKNSIFDVEELLPQPASGFRGVPPVEITNRKQLAAYLTDTTGIAAKFIKDLETFRYHFQSLPYPPHSPPPSVQELAIRVLNVLTADSVQAIPPSGWFDNVMIPMARGGSAIDWESNKLLRASIIHILSLYRSGCNSVIRNSAVHHNVGMMCMWCHVCITSTLAAAARNPK